MSKELTQDELWLRASAYCAKGEHCRQEVREKLWQWGCRNEQWREDILNKLQTDNYINHSRYCQAYVHDKVAYQCWGRIKIRMMLMAKGLDENNIDTALQNINMSEYYSALQKALDKYPFDTERQIRLALQRGFEYNEIKALLKN